MKKANFQRINKSSDHPAADDPEAQVLLDTDEWAFAPWGPDGGPLLVKTMQGLEPLLANELRQMGAEGVQELTRAVTFMGNQEMLYRANYELRTALRVLIPIHAFPAFNEKQFYEGIREINWARYMDVDDTLAIDAVVQSTLFRHSHFMALLAKDGIADQFRERTGRRPSVELSTPTLRIHVHIRNHNQCQILLDSSGDSLHMRGYRRDHVAAPINEVLGAGMILHSGWNGKGAFVDPMCGSGTLPIEAAMIAGNIPAQKNRSLRFGFEGWPGFDAALWEKVRKAADERISTFEFPIIASDMDSRAINATSVNVMAAGVESGIIIQKQRFEHMMPPEETGCLMMNPPYDERLKIEDVEKFYGSIGEILKHRWTGWNAWIISANTAALKKIGLRPSGKLKLMNGALECTFQGYELFQGKRNTRFEEK